MCTPVTALSALPITQMPLPCWAQVCGVLPVAVVLGILAPGTSTVCGPVPISVRPGLVMRTLSR